MSVCNRIRVLCALLIVTGISSGQQIPASNPKPQVVHFNVTVTTASGRWVTDLKEQDFTILDDQTNQSITSFRSVWVGGQLFQYQLTFDHPHADASAKFHKVEVKVHRPNLTVSTRDGYYAQP